MERKNIPAVDGAEVEAATSGVDLADEDAGAAVGAPERGLT